jgi:predicted CopG family antitoxin
MYPGLGRGFSGSDTAFVSRTISIDDDDVFTIARQKSLKERVSLGHAISDLIRQGKRDEIITSEHVYKLLEQEGTEVR